MAASRVMPCQGSAGSRRVSQLVAGPGVPGEVAVDGHHDQIGAGDVAEGFEADGQRGNGGLHPVGAQIMAEPAHQPGVVDLADRVLIALLVSGFFCSFSAMLIGDSGLRFHCTGTPGLLCLRK